MPVEKWIEENRTAILEEIASICPNAVIDDDDEIHDWILNEAGLYYWALSDDVDL